MKRRGDGEGSIDQGSDGRWRARLRFVDPITGLSQRAEWRGPNRQGVVDRLDEARRRLRSGKTARDEGVTLSRFLDAWLKDVVKPTKRDSTARQYESLIENHLKPKLGHRKLRDLRQPEIQHILISASKATPRIKQLALVVLRRALEQAVKWQMLDVNPAKGIVPPRFVKPERRVLSPREARAFLEAAEGDRLYALYYLALDTGMREGELFALRWDDVDLERGSIRILRTIDTATGKVGPTKTKASRRSVELGSGAKAVLVAHRKRVVAEELHGTLVFPNTVGRPLNPANVRLKSFIPLQALAGIDPPIRFHDLRHTAATLMLELGANPKIVSERLGHATIAITMDTYQHVSQTMQRDLAGKMDRVLSTPKGDKTGGRARSRGREKARKV